MNFTKKIHNLYTEKIYYLYTMSLPKYNFSYGHLPRKVGALGRMRRNSMEHFLAGREERGEIEQISWIDNKTVTYVELFFPPPDVHLIRYENDVWPKRRKVSCRQTFLGKWTIYSIE